jgi:hypothetical protein
MSVPITVVGLGCELDRVYAGQAPALPLPAPPAREDLRDLFDTVRGPIRSGETVVIIVGDWLPPETLKRVQTVHSLLATDRVAIYVTDLPPLATSVLAAVAAAIGPYAQSAGALAGALDAIADRLLIVAWAGSVSGLDHSAVSIVDHARSALPWTSFGIGIQPESFVQSLRGTPSPPPLSPPRHPVDLLVAPAAEGELSWIVEMVAPALGGAAVRQLPPTLHGAEWWGTDKLVEAVGVPSSLDWIAQAALPRTLAPCAWCGEPIAGGPCPFCGDSTFESASAVRARERSSGVVPASAIAVGRRSGHPGE